ncbi:hypothetical protein B0T18DRAFT_469771 [Schizothecium vesticola]|uniref:Uncharacterized protein n=1 Tax=Schizothecium vesticola TaxID=314040 RepID=A0AA40ER65_9PEZI|nr:hypothetical protein B0T18DRAFT_469771 [Schizothecium vesticola]
MLLKVDEAQTGVRRCSGLMASTHHERIVPNVLTQNKTVSTPPMSTTLCQRWWADEVLEIVVPDNSVQHARKMGEVLHARLRKLEDQDGYVGAVRGRGLLTGMEIVAN